MILPKTMNEWCRHPMTKEAVEFIEKTWIEALRDVLIGACATSTDPEVRERWARYHAGLTMVQAMKGNVDREGD